MIKDWYESSSEGVIRGIDVSSEGRGGGIGRLEIYSEVKRDCK